MGERYILNHSCVDVRVLVLREYGVLVSSGIDQSFHFVENGNAWAHPERILDCENHENCTALLLTPFTLLTLFTLFTQFTLIKLFTLFIYILI